MAIDLQHEANKALHALNTGQFNPALKTARAAIKYAPREAFFHNLAGLALSRMSKERDAIPYFQKAIALNPDFLEAQRNMAQALFMLGKFDKVHSLLDRLLAKNPNDSDALYLKGMSLTKEGDFKAAEAYVTRAIDTGHAVGRSLNLRAIIRQEIDNLSGAIADYEQSLALTPDVPDTLSNYSFALSLKGRVNDAEAALQKALAIKPDHISSLLRLGGLMNETDRSDESKAIYRRALAVAPSDIGALCSLAGLQDKAENAALLPDLLAALSHCPKGTAARTDLGFALWHVYKQAGDLAEAEKWLLMANKNAATFRPFDIAPAAARQEQVFAHFTGAGPLAENPDDSGPTPIFVLGLIRSGTTLTEQIISSHSTVYGAGEMATAGYVYEQLLDGDTDAGQPFSAEKLAEFARQYRSHLPDMPAGTQAFVDKMPGNFRLIGVLLAAFPNCRIVNLVRDPRDTALSAFSNNFPAAGLNYTYDLRSLAAQFNFYRSTINRWDALFPGRILHHSYSDMVRDIDTSSRRLAAFCGLEWEPAMTRPQDNKRAVMTASVNQVRAGVHTKSLAGWRRHEAMLQPLIEALDPALWPELAD